MSDISKLNSVLFDQLEKLSSANTDEEIKKEVERAQAITSVAKQVIDAGTLAVSAEKVRQEYRSPNSANPLLGRLT